MSALVMAEMLDRVPPFNEDWEAEPAPLAVAELRRLIAESNALLGKAAAEQNGVRLVGPPHGLED